MLRFKKNQWAGPVYAFVYKKKCIWLQLKYLRPESSKTHRHSNPSPTLSSFPVSLHRIYKLLGKLKLLYLYKIVSSEEEEKV